MLTYIELNIYLYINIKLTYIAHMCVLFFVVYRLNRLGNLRAGQCPIMHISPTALSALFYGYRIIYECRFVMKQFPRNPSNIVTISRADC